jgi:hypothetical protein
MMLMILPEQCHEHVHVEQKRHANWASMSLTNWEVITPFAARMMGNPSSPITIVNVHPSLIRGCTEGTQILQIVEKLRWNGDSTASVTSNQ